MNKIFSILLAALFFGALVSLNAQPEEQRFRRITIDDGLSQNTVVAICQDSLGFLWFGTKDGLNRYNGHEFSVFQYHKDDSLSLGGNNVRSLLVDTYGDIWVGSSNGVLSRFSYRKQYFERITLPSVDKTIALTTIDALELDNEGFVWAATLTEGIYRIDPKTLAVDHIHATHPTFKLPSNSVTSLKFDSNGELWVGTHEEGLAQLNFKNKNITYYTAADNDLPDNRIYSIYQDSNGTIWVGTQAGSAWFDEGTGRFRPILINPLNYPTPAVMAFAQNDPGNLWLSVYPQGIVKLDLQSLEWISYQADPYSQYSLSLNDVRKLFVDRNKNLWIGTNGGGVNMLPKHQNFSLYRHMPTQPASLPGNSIRSIVEDNEGNLYVGVYGGLMVYYRDTKTYKHYTSGIDLTRDMHNTSVYTLRKDPSGKIWIGFEGGGVQIMDPETGLLKAYHNQPGDSTSLLNDHVLSFLIDSKGQAWVGHHAGVSKLDEGTGTFRHYLNPRKVFAGPYARALVEDKPGYLWVGTDYGLFYLEEATGKYVLFPNLEGVDAKGPEISIYSLHKDTDGILWVGTQGAGFHKLEYAAEGLVFKRAVFTCICPEAPYKNLTGYGILEDDMQNLWISSDNGLFRYSKKTGKWLQFTKTDGLQSNEFNASAYYKAADGRLYFGGINGLNAFYPSKLQFNTTPPPVVLTGFKIFNKPYQLGQNIALIKNIQLKHNQNYLTFEFAALDYTAPEKNEYAYQLVGFDDDWIYPGSVRQVTYSNLPAGEYVFKVKASNKDHYWNQDGVSLKIVITPAFYTTWWFKGILIALALVIVILIFRTQVAGFRERQKLLEEQLKTQSQKLQLEKLKTEYAVSQALIEGQNQEQKRISEDLHDGLGQTLTAASLNLMALDNALKGNNVEKTEDYMGNLQLLLGGAIQEVRNISHNLMPYLLAEEGLGAALEEMCHRAMKSSNLIISLQITGEDERIGESNEINLYRIAQEVISNTQKHSGAQNLHIKFNVRHDVVTWVSEDDGIGFDPKFLSSARNTGMGLKNIEVRVHLMKGTMKISTKPGKGLKIEIEVPRG